MPLLTRLLRSPVARAIIAALPGVVTLVVVAAAFLAVHAMQTSQGAVRHTRAVLDVSHAVLTRSVDAESGVRGYLATGEPAFLKPYKGAESQVRAYVVSLRMLASDRVGQARRLVRLDSLTVAQFADLDRLVTLRAARQGLLPAAELRGEMERMDSLRTVIAQVDAVERELLDARVTSETHALHAAEVIVLVGGAVSVLVVILVNGALARDAAALRRASEARAEQATQLAHQATVLESQAHALEENNAELARQRDAANTARVEAEHANAAKARFLATMSHELRTPLNAVIGYVDIIDAGVQGPVTADQRESLARVKRAAQHLTRLIADILNYARLEAGEVRLTVAPVVMAEALSAAATLMEPQAEAKGLNFEYEPCETDVVAMGDRDRIQQIILNLLTNAVRYTPPGRAVALSCQSGDGVVAVTVRDTGRGIAAEDLTRIFERFVQGRRRPDEPGDGGVGLGLAISRDLARAMGGDITVESEPGRGATFRVTLPRAPVAAPPSVSV